MRASLGKTCKESASRVALLSATMLALVTLVMTPAAAATLHPVARVTAPLPSLHLVTLDRGVDSRPDGRLTPTLAAALPTTVTVVSGDTLSGLAQAHLGSPARWTDLWNDNRSRVSDPNLIQPGWTLALPAGHVDPPAGTVSVIVAPVQRQAPVTRRAATPAPTRGAHVNPGDYAGFQACVIRRESSGNPRAVNPRSGAGGLYGFLPSTWHGLGFSGLPENAPVSVQNAAFEKEYALAGTAPWAPYDGC